MTNYIEQYILTCKGILDALLEQSSEDILKASGVVLEAIKNDRDVLTYGSGHSALIAQDGAGRAGGLIPLMAIEDIAHGDAERLEGVAKIILGRYALEPGGVIFIISNSGINPVPVEMALLCKAAGLTVIAITCLAHSQSVASRHSSGKKLYELADIVIDTQGAKGDAVITLPGGQLKSGATSTLAGVTILQAITVQVAATLAEEGIEPPIFMSANLPEGDAHNARQMARYRSRLVRYQLPDYGG